MLLPHTWAAVRAARADRLQTSLNLAIGSALASIRLTIPAVALVAALLGMPLQLGLDAKDSCCWRSPSRSAPSPSAAAARTSCREPCTW